MAQTLRDRIAAALQPSTARLPDVRATLADAVQAKADAEADLAAAEAKLVDPLSSSDDVTQAGLDAAEHRVTIARLEHSIPLLQASIRSREADIAKAERAQRYEAAKVERNALVEHLRGPVADALRLVADANARIAASDAELEIVNKGAKGDAWIASAEAVARGCNPHFWHRNSKLMRLVDMRIPALDASGETLWPPSIAERERSAERQRLSIRSARRQIGEQAAREAARWGWYECTPPKGMGAQLTIEERRRSSGLYRDPRTVELDAAEVERLRDLGVTVKPAATALYRVSDGDGDGPISMGGRSIETCAGRARIGREPSDHELTESQALAAEADGFQLEPVQLAEAAE